MSLKDRLQDDVKAAMRSRDKSRLGVLRLIMAAIKQQEVDERIMLKDGDVVAILGKMLKQRKESLVQFEAANRNDLAQQEIYESDIIQTYMPEPLGDAEIAALIDAAMTDTGASSIKDMGKVIGQLKPKLQGRADMSAVSQAIKAKLGA